MAPELGQAVEPKTDGKGSTVAVMQINRAGAACPVGIKFDSILTETNPVAASGINLRVVWSSLRSTQLNRIGSKVHLGEHLEVKYHSAPFQVFLTAITVAVLPQATVSWLQIPVTVQIEVEIIDCAILDGLKLGPVDLDNQRSGCSGEPVIGHGFEYFRYPNSGNNTDDSQGNDHLLESYSSFFVFHGSHLPKSKRQQQGYVPPIKGNGWVGDKVPLGRLVGIEKLFLRPPLLRGPKEVRRIPTISLLEFEICDKPYEKLYGIANKNSFPCIFGML